MKDARQVHPIDEAAPEGVQQRAHRTQRRQPGVAMACQQGTPLGLAFSAFGIVIGEALQADLGAHESGAIGLAVVVEPVGEDQAMGVLVQEGHPLRGPRVSHG